MGPMSVRAMMVRCLVMALLCLPHGEAADAQERRAVRSSAAQPSELVWPSPPSPAAVRFVATLPRADGEANHGSFIRKLGRIISAGSKEEMLRPLGVAASRGLLFLTDPGGHALLIYDSGRNSLQKITRAGRDTLETPVGVVAENDRIFLSDSSLKKVLVYDRRGHFVKTFAGEPLERPTGLAFDEKSGKLYVADTSAHQVRVYRGDGSLERSFGQRGSGKGEFNFPTHLWLGRDGSLFVVDSLNYRIQVFGPDGGFAGAFGKQGDSSGEFASPKGIATDSHGHVYVVDALFDTVQIFDRSGQLLLTFGERGAGPGQFWLPAGIFIDDKDRIYVADSYNQRIQVFEFLGVPGHEN